MPFPASFPLSREPAGPDVVSLPTPASVESLGFDERA